MCAITATVISQLTTVTRLEDHLVGNKKALGKGCLQFLGSKAALKLRVTHDAVKGSNTQCKDQ